MSGGGGAATVYFPIRATAIGEVPLKLTGRSDVAGDAIEKSLLVEPEGHRVDRNVPVVIDLGETNPFERTVQLDFPPEAVPGSQRGTRS